MNRLRGTIIYKLNRSQLGECSFCYQAMSFNENLIQLTCFNDHQFHENCYNDFIKYFEEKNIPLLCPHCRRPVEKDKVIKKKVEDASKISAEEAFNVSPAQVQAKVNNADSMSANQTLSPMMQAAVSQD